MIESSCHCGAKKLEIERPPEGVTDCNCSICRRYGALWAYYSPQQVRIAAANGANEISTCDDRSIEFHRCRNCGCVAHWSGGPGPRPHGRERASDGTGSFGEREGSSL